jgi:hypothetical protein
MKIFAIRLENGDTPIVSGDTTAGSVKKCQLAP